MFCAPFQFKCQLRTGRRGQTRASHLCSREMQSSLFLALMLWGSSFVPIRGSAFLDASKDPPTAVRSDGCAETSCSPVTCQQEHELSASTEISAYPRDKSPLEQTCLPQTPCIPGLFSCDFFSWKFHPGSRRNLFYSCPLIYF